LLALFGSLQFLPKNFWKRLMHGRACIKQAARTLHIRKSNRIHFSFLSWSEQSSGCARTTLPGQGPPEARPTPCLEASTPLPCFAFPFQHAKQRRPGRRRHHRVAGRFIQTRQAKYIQTTGTYKYART
jgi:hypothetical protein